MCRRLGFAGLALSLLMVLARLFADENIPEARARCAFRLALAAASSHWQSVELEYSPSEGCGYSAGATWTGGGKGYVFGAVRYPDAIGGTFVTVRPQMDDQNDSVPCLTCYRFAADGTLQWVKSGAGGEVDLDWLGPRAREFVAALPAYK